MVFREPWRRREYPRLRPGGIRSCQPLVRPLPFIFNGNSGENFTNARLGGIAKVSTGIVLVGSSAPSMSEKFRKENQQLFIQIVSPVTQKSMLSGSRRKGSSCGSSRTDTGVKWLTNYKDASVTASAVAVMERQQILVLWEKESSAGTESYYMVLSPHGENSAESHTDRKNFSERLRRNQV